MFRHVRCEGQLACAQTDRQRQTDRGRQTDRQTDRQKHRQIDRQTDSSPLSFLPPPSSFPSCLRVSVDARSACSL
eukprot:3519926-Rhodomonas_salina.1